MIMIRSARLQKRHLLSLHDGESRPDSLHEQVLQQQPFNRHHYNRLLLLCMDAARCCQQQGVLKHSTDPAKDDVAPVLLMQLVLQLVLLLLLLLLHELDALLLRGGPLEHPAPGAAAQGAP
jgi:hypothetical protein